MLVALLFSCCTGLQRNATALFAQTIARSQSSNAHQTAHSASNTFSKQPEKRAVPPAPSIQFENVTKTSKINFILKNSISPQRYTFETMAGGVALFDYNNDGLLDIFFTNGAAIPSLEKTTSAYGNRLFRNNGGGTFTNVTEKAGLQGVGYSMGAAAADYDNDGFIDLYVTGVNHNQVFHNNGDGTFTDVTGKAGVAGIVPKLGKAWSVAAGWFDYNNDGLLDLFVVNYLHYAVGTAKLCVQGGHPAYCSPVDFLGTPNILYRNNGNGTFTDVSEQSHISQYVGKGMGVAFADYDNDGFTDIFVSNDTFENYLFHNNGDGTFTNVALSAGVAYNAFGNAIAGMGADFRDIDNDGKADIYETAMVGEGFPLYRNLGDGQFQDVSSTAGLTPMTGRLTGWASVSLTLITMETRTSSSQTRTFSTIRWSWLTGLLRFPIAYFVIEGISLLRTRVRGRELPFRSPLLTAGRRLAISIMTGESTPL